MKKNKPGKKLESGKEELTERKAFLPAKSYARGGAPAKGLPLIFSLLGATVIIAVWWILAETAFKRTGVVPSPIETIEIIGREAQKPRFAAAVFSTLLRSLISFAVSFTLASAAAAAAHFNGYVKSFLSPFIALCRAVPTAALVLILLLAVPSGLVPAAVSFLVVFPLCYENLLAALSGVDKSLITMAKVFKVPKARRFSGIYLPAMLPYVAASVIAGFGLNIKVVISAEILGLPSVSIGYLILSAKQALDFGAAFAWLIIAVVLSFICELILKAVFRLCMPHKYPDLKILKSAAKRIAGKIQKR